MFFSQVWKKAATANFLWRDSLVGFAQPQEVPASVLLGGGIWGRSRWTQMAGPCTSSTQHIATLCVLQRPRLCGIWRSGGMLTKCLSHQQPNMAIDKNSADRIQEKSFIFPVYINGPKELHFHQVIIFLESLQYKP